MRTCPAFAFALAACATAPPMPSFLRVSTTWTIDSLALGETRRICVYTPPGYAEDATARFPVLYMPDGGIDEDFVHVAEVVHFGIAWGLLRPVLVVGIENTERRRDLTGPTEIASDLEIAPRVGGSATFRAFLRDELIPTIEARYRTDGERAIVGESLAGLFVVETFLLAPDLFTTCIAISPSLWWNDHGAVREAERCLRAGPDRRGTLYLTNADEDDIAPFVAELATIVARAAPAVALIHEPMPTQFHDTVFRAAAPKALRTVFAPR
ncbi:MAG: alpha/beta hydrolase [Planctomycetes bacterium]|nr:alpha/beta hydrolase [Planctomycetota bacterium]